jgi:hypothetical protein
MARNPLPLWLHSLYRDNCTLCDLRLSSLITETDVTLLGYNAACYFKQDTTFQDILSIPFSGFMKQA